MKQLEKIISGGQTGVDRGSLEAALESGLAIGGWCPPNRLAEDGVIPDNLPFEETPEERSGLAPDVPRSLRTEWNVRDSDATLILAPINKNREDPGTVWTKTCCTRMNKPLLICNPYDSKSFKKIVEWLNYINPKVLNLAGPSELNSPGIQKAAKQLISDILLLRY